AFGTTAGGAFGRSDRRSVPGRAPRGTSSDDVRRRLRAARGHRGGLGDAVQEEARRDHPPSGLWDAEMNLRLGLEPQERRLFALMCLLVLILLCAYTIAKVLRDALF